MSILDEVSVRLAHSLSRRIGLTKEQVVSLALCRLIIELGHTELFESALNVQDILIRISPELGLGQIENELQIILNIISYIEIIGKKASFSPRTDQTIDEIVTKLSRLRDRVGK